MPFKKIFFGGMIIALFLNFGLFSQGFSQSNIYRFSTYRWDIPGYKENLYMLMNQMGRGANSWTIPANSTVSFNRHIGGLGVGTSNFAGEVYNVLSINGSQIPGGGACDVASWFGYVAVQNGLQITPDSNNHPTIPDVPSGYQISIWRYDTTSTGTGRIGPQDLLITNPTSTDMTFHWNYDDSSFSIWMDNVSGEYVSAQVEENSNIPAVEVAVEEISETGTSGGGGPVDYQFFIPQEENLIDKISKNIFPFMNVILTALVIYGLCSLGLIVLALFHHGSRNAALVNLIIIATTLFAFNYAKEVQASLPKPERDPLITISVKSPSVQATPATEAVAINSANADCSVLQKFPTEVTQWCEPILHYSNQYGLDPVRVAFQMYYESGGNPLAYSHSGAIGLMQIMPRDGIAADFMCVNGPCFADRPTIEELKDPWFNIDTGTSLMTILLKYHNGDYREALKSYGPMDVGYDYADFILTNSEKYR